LTASQKELISSLRATLNDLVAETGIKLNQKGKNENVAQLTEYMNKINAILASANKDDIKKHVDMDSLKGSLKNVQTILASEAENKSY